MTVIIDGGTLFSDINLTSNSKLTPITPKPPSSVAARRGPGPGAPVRLIVNAPGAWAVTPWIRWLRAKGWHVHVVGRAAYAHHPEVPGLPGWLVGFAVVGERPPAWLRWLVVHRTREVRRSARQAVTT